MTLVSFWMAGPLRSMTLVSFWMAGPQATEETAVSASPWQRRRGCRARCHPAHSIKMARSARIPPGWWGGRTVGRDGMGWGEVLGWDGMRWRGIWWNGMELGCDGWGGMRLGRMGWDDQRWGVARRDAHGGCAPDAPVESDCLPITVCHIPSLPVCHTIPSHLTHAPTHASRPIPVPHIVSHPSHSITATTIPSHPTHAPGYPGLAVP